MRIIILKISVLLVLSNVVQAQNAFEVEIYGSENKEVLLFFPGFASSGAIWHDAVSELSKDYRCYVFTFAGFGDVPPIEVPWLTTIRDQIAEYITAENLHRPTLIGHSLGGTLGYWMAITHPDMFKEIIAVDALPGTIALMFPDYNGEVLEYDNPQSDYLLNMDSSAFEQTIEQQVAFMSLKSEKHPELVAMMKKTDRKTYVYGYIDMLNLDLRNEMSKIKIPVTVLAATHPDPELVKQTYEMQFRELPSTRFRYAENAAHYVMIDRPEWFLENIKEILKTNG